jgi:aspartyl aminopeptidase
MKARQTTMLLLRFSNASHSQFHVVEESMRRLTEAGYTRISETSTNFRTLEKGGKYFFSRNQSALIAFAVGGNFEPGNGFVIIGAHTDSPVPKVKPVSKLTKAGFQQVGIELYGGGNRCRNFS